MRAFPTGATKDTDVAWAAGLFEGEGCVFLQHTGARIRNDGSTCREDGYWYPRLGMSQTDLDVLERFVEIVGGVVRGPYRGKDDRKPLYHWASQKNAVAVAQMLYPYLGYRRQGRMLEVFGETVFNWGDQRC